MRGQSRCRSLLRPSMLLAVLLTLAVGACTDRRSPEHAVEQIITAVADRNRLRLEAFVDQDRLAEALADQASQRALAEARGQPGGSDRELFLGISLSRGAEVEMARAAIRDAVERLTDPEREHTPHERDVLHRARIGSVQRVEHMAEVEILLHGGGESRRLIARLESSGERWRLVGLEDLPAWSRIMERP